MEMIKILKITVKDLQKKISLDPRRIRRVIRNVLSKEGAKLSGELTVCFVTDKEIKKLNLRYLRHNFATDVISFCVSGDPRKYVADIAISCDTAARNAKIYGTDPKAELELYAIHGTLHLLGYDDATPRKTSLMRKKESLYAHQ